MLLNVIKYSRRRSEETEHQTFELVEQILALLENTCGASEKQHVAVRHVRDSLIPPRERKAKFPFWDKAVEFIDQHDSRVGVQGRVRCLFHSVKLGFSEEFLLRGDSFHFWLEIKSSFL